MRRASRRANQRPIKTESRDEWGEEEQLNEKEEVEEIVEKEEERHIISRKPSGRQSRIHRHFNRLFKCEKPPRYLTNNELINSI